MQSMPVNVDTRHTSVQTVGWQRDLDDDDGDDDDDDDGLLSEGSVLLNPFIQNDFFFGTPAIHRQ